MTLLLATLGAIALFAYIVSSALADYPAASRATWIIAAVVAVAVVVLYGLPLWHR